MAPSPTPAFACPICGRTYQRSNHLRRHEATHSAPNQFHCRHCGKSFGRRDVFRKHLGSCRANTGRDELPPAKRGKRPRACDACSRNKVSCDGGSPCGRCSLRRAACAYTRVLAADGTASAPTLENGGSAHPIPARASPTAGQSSAADNTKIPVSFLLGLTNPKAESMIEVFWDEPRRDDDDAPGIALEPSPSPAGFTPDDADAAAAAAAGEGFLLPWLLGPFASDPFPDLTAFAPFSLPADPELAGSGLGAGIDPTMAPIVSDLAALHETLRLTNPPDGAAAFDAGLAGQVFTTPNREAFISAYFRHTHRDMPLVHRPTFDAAAAAGPLVLAMFLCGAQFCPPRDCVLATPAFFRIADEYAFRALEEQLAAVHERPDGRVGGAGEGAAEERQEKGWGWGWERAERRLYETLQGCVLVHGLLFLVNDAAARRRNFAVRKPALVQAVWRLGLSGARHTQAGEEMPDWGLFVRDEMRIRVAMWTTLLDWHQAGVFHTPGLMTIHQMTGDMPCHQDLWEANDAAEFEAVVATKGSGSWRRSASLRDCMDALTGDAWSGAAGFPLRLITILDLHIIINALHAMIGMSRFFSLLQTSIPTLQRAADRWEDLWRATTASLDAEQLRLSGLVRHSGEFCWLARALLEHARAGKDRASPYFQRIGHASSKELHELFRQLRGV